MIIVIIWHSPLQLHVLLYNDQCCVPILGRSLRRLVFSSKNRGTTSNAHGLEIRNVSHIAIVNLWFHLTLAVLFRRTSQTSQTTKSFHFINPTIVHLIDDIFWTMGFKSSDCADKVWLFWLFWLSWLFWLLHLTVQVLIARGILEQIWINKRCMLAKTVDDLGERFRPTLHAAWLVFIKKTYPVDEPAHGVSKSAGTFVEDDE